MGRRDIRDNPLYQEAKGLYNVFRRPGSGLISDAAEISVQGARAAFTGTLVDSSGEAASRICLTDLDGGHTRVLTFGPNCDRLPKLAPDGRHVAFLSDRDQAGNFQLYLMDTATWECRATPAVTGCVEYLHWSPNGRRILLGAAGDQSESMRAQDATKGKTIAQELPAWMPTIEASGNSLRWRRAWSYNLDDGQLLQVSSSTINVWEAVWCGDQAIAAIASPGASERLWYQACLRIIDIEDRADRELYKPTDQLGWPAASPSGRRLAVVEGMCSDRWVVAGELRLIDTTSGAVKTVPTGGVDITCTEWRSERYLLLAGHRQFETVVAVYDVERDEVEEVWKSEEISTGGSYVRVAGLGDPGDCVLIGEGFKRPPEIGVIRRGDYQSVISFGPAAEEILGSLAAVEIVEWLAPDGLEIKGLLLRPAVQPPYALVIAVHGGPVWHFHPAWLGRRSVATLMLLKRGYAIFLPNSRGSSGRGQEFVRRILGDLGGSDTHDHLSGLDHLVQQGIADAGRLGVLGGGSYGGFVAAWLITQDPRFAAAVAVSPVINPVTERLISDVPHLTPLLLGDTHMNPGGKYYTRSPILHAHKANTPTLITCGSLDRCAAPAEAAQFHNALRENGVDSELVTYPQEGHGVGAWPATVDLAARFVDWFERHMPAARESVGSP